MKCCFVCDNVMLMMFVCVMLCCFGMVLMCVWCDVCVMMCVGVMVCDDVCWCGCLFDVFDGVVLVCVVCGVVVCVVVGVYVLLVCVEFYIEDVLDGLCVSESDLCVRWLLKLFMLGLNGKVVEKCVNKCLVMCVCGGGGGLGLGLVSVCCDLIVFKDSFWLREYCLFECADICSRSFEVRGR